MNRNVPIAADFHINHINSGSNLSLLKNNINTNMYNNVSYANNGTINHNINSINSVAKENAILKKI